MRTYGCSTESKFEVPHIAADGSSMALVNIEFLRCPSLSRISSPSACVDLSKAVYDCVTEAYYVKSVQVASLMNCCHFR